MRIECKGILFIGDPHVSSKSIGRRKDDYLGSVLTKLAECTRLSRENGLFPVILGDLFHKSNDNNLSMLNRLVEVLQQFAWTPFVLEGNHDKEQFHLGVTDALMLLQRTKTAQVVTTPGFALELLVQGQPVDIYAVPYGAPIPDEVPLRDGSKVVMVTHHDLAFGGAYPGALPLKGVRNVCMAVNGHMHDTKPSVSVDGTFWHNPGNIEPLSIDLAQHVPAAWEWMPESSELKRHVLPHAQDIFDLTGLQVEAANADQAVAELIEQSAFAQMLSESDGTLDAVRTDDATILKEDLDVVLASAGASAATQSLLRSLAASLA